MTSQTCPRCSTPGAGSHGYHRPALEEVEIPLPDKVVELASGPNYCVLSTVLPGGHPQSHVMWVDTDGDHVLINTATHRRKYLNVLDNPKVSVTIINGTDFFDWVEVRGTVVATVTGEEAWNHIESLSRKYFDAPFGGPPVERVILKIAPDRVVTHKE